MNDVAKNFGENLKRIRMAKNISRKELAAAVGTTENICGKYERAESSPPYDKLFLIAEKLDCSIVDLLGDIDSAKDRKVFEYRLQKAIDMAKSLRCEVAFLSDDKISVTLPPSFTVENGTLFGKNVEVNYDISFAPITFDNAKVFISVMESIEKSALLENNFFLKKFQEIFFKTNRNINNATA